MTSGGPPWSGGEAHPNGPHAGCPWPRAPSALCGGTGRGKGLRAAERAGRPTGGRGWTDGRRDLRGPHSLRAWTPWKPSLTPKTPPPSPSPPLPAPLPSCQCADTHTRACSRPRRLCSPLPRVCFASAGLEWGQAALAQLAASSDPPSPPPTPEVPYVTVRNKHEAPCRGGHRTWQLPVTPSRHGGGFHRSGVSSTSGVTQGGVSARSLVLPRRDPAASAPSSEQIKRPLTGTGRPEPPTLPPSPVCATGRPAPPSPGHPSAPGLHPELLRVHELRWSIPQGPGTKAPQQGGGAKPSQHLPRPVLGSAQVCTGRCSLSPPSWALD